MSSKSKRQRVAVYSSDQTDETQQSDANTNTMVLDVEELSKNIPSDKKLTDGRQYVVRKTKRTAIKFEPVFGGITIPSGDKDSEMPPDNDDWAKLKSEDDGLLGSNYLQSIRERAERLEGSNEYDRSELDRYLTDQLGPTEKGMDALTWWGQYGQRYPILSHMARDVLAIPLSTVASESAFSAGGRILDPFRSSLTPKMVQALVCSQDWLRTKGSLGVDIEENLRELEELEKDICEDDMYDQVIYVDSLI